MKELILSFPNVDRVAVRLDGDSTRPLAFKAPLTAEDLSDIRWYLEVYGTQYTTDMDDARARRIAGQLAPWGAALFDAVFQDSHAQRLFWSFYDHLGDDPGLITIDTCEPAVLSLPWELLCRQGRHLVHEYPHISIRRRLTGAGGTGRRFTPASKDTLHLLFAVSRPKDAGFIDPRADALAVMDALDQNAPGRVAVEFLRPATLDNLTLRLRCQGPEHRGKPPVDILHFDGHGVFDPHGTLIRKAVQSDPAAASRDTDTALKPDTGYLVFENDKGNEALVTSETLGNMLTNQKVSLVVLSACQSAAVGAESLEEADDDQGKAKAINGVAARLVESGLPCVIAMSHTVLVETTRRLFGSFYARLGDHLAVGAALDEARQHLYAHPERGERRRGQQDLVTLRLQDWFLPALYQSGADVPLLTRQAPGQPVKMSAAPETGEGDGKLPAPPQSGFFGRTLELWKIERNFIAGTRRITVTGFGGQGKTVLAAEAGRWLVRTGMFEKCCFVGFAAYQGIDPVSFCTSALSVTLEQNLIDGKAAEQALAATPTLIILDNIESLQDDTGDRQSALLEAAAAWSRAGNSRVLITTRQHRLAHPQYPEAGDPAHRYLDLSGLAQHDAVACFAALWALPPDPDPRIQVPARHGLVNLFGRVDFHPLSVCMLAYQLKFRTAAELGERLEKLLAEAPGKGPEKNLRASLDLSLERLSPDMTQ
ncbi:MAG: CHAT domain-containing protein, partial [Desulfobacteraceae bacterium]